jgi:integrase
VGRWLTQEHPTVTSPEDWTCELATAYVAALDRATVGGLAARTKNIPAEKLGKPFSARAKATYLATLRSFFQNCQDWGWLERRFTPSRCLATPRTIRALIGPAPRVIADDIWAKLVWAGLNLTETDMPGTIWAAEPHAERRAHWYPLAMVRAVVLVWLFAGLRSDELVRLRVGCIRWLPSDGAGTGAAQPAPPETICWLDVPVNKTSTAFTKPVDRLVGEAIAAWEAQRPPQPAMVDPKTGEVVQMVFAYRGRRLGHDYLNRTIIPLLCQKAGVPEHDARGNFTSHRARSTIASQLANAREPMSLYEIQQWLGHRSPASTIHYLRPTPTRLAQVFRDAEYLTRNLRTIAVLIDQAAIRSGAAAAGEPWRYYDLGHGYCSYDFFDQCPHRMACAKCAFYLPKASTQAQLLEAKANLGRMLQDIPLTEEERAAVEDGVQAIEQLCARLVDVPTPTGQTPRQMAATTSELIPLTPLTPP